jgi:hypothetical protein
MKVDLDIIEEAIKQGMPKKPMREDFSNRESFEECYGYWMSHYGRVLALRQQARNYQKTINSDANNKK